MHRPAYVVVSCLPRLQTTLQQTWAMGEASPLEGIAMLTPPLHHADAFQPHFPECTDCSALLRSVSCHLHNAPSAALRHRAGFTTGTGDGLWVVNRYVKAKPVNNTLAPFVPALARILAERMGNASAWTEVRRGRAVGAGADGMMRCSFGWCASCCEGRLQLVQMHSVLERTRGQATPVGAPFHDCPKRYLPASGSAAGAGRQRDCPRNHRRR